MSEASGSAGSGPAASQDPAEPPPIGESVTRVHGGTTVISVVLVVAAVYLAKPFLVPLTAALLLSLLIRPLVRFLSRFGLPRWAGAIVLVLGLSVLLLSLVSLALPTATRAVRNLPQTLDTVRERVGALAEPIEQIKEVESKLEEMIEPRPEDAGERSGVRGAGVEGIDEGGHRDEDGLGVAEQEPGREPVPVTVQSYDTLTRVLGVTGSTMFSLLLSVVLAFFLSATDEWVLLRLAKLLPGLGGDDRAAQMLGEMEASLSFYLLTLTAINAGVGVAMTAAAWALGVPQPWALGLIAGLLNYVPYLGAFAALGLITAISVLAFPTLTQAAGPPLAFLVINGLEAYVIGPLVYGDRLRLNPVAILVGLMFFAWLWGLPGVVVAVPVLLCTKMVCEYVPRWSGLGSLIAAAGR